MKAIWDAFATNAPGLCIIGTLFLFVTRAIVRDEIRKLNGTYLRKELASEKFSDLQHQIDYLRGPQPAGGGK